MRIIYTNHFWEQLKERGCYSPVPIAMELIEETIKNPDFSIQDPKFPEREWRVKKVAGRCFKVIVENRDNEFVAIILMFDRVLRRKGLCR